MWSYAYPLVDFGRIVIIQIDSSQPYQWPIHQKTRVLLLPILHRQSMRRTGLSASRFTTDGSREN